VTAERELQVGVVGLGFGERVHVPGWRAVPGVSVEMVCSRGDAADTAARAGIPRWTDDWRELVADPAIDIVSIATPPATHHAIALAALSAGKAVLCEKPLAVTDAEAEELAAAATAGPAAVNFSYRALPAFRLARERIHAGALGDVLDVDVRWHVRARLDAATWSWKDSAELGGGALAVYGVHALDYVEWLAGPITDLSATLDIPRAERDGRPVTSDDACAIELTLESGARGAVDVSLVAVEHMHRVELRGARETLVLENRDPRDPVGAFTLAADGVAVALPETPRRVPASADPRVEPFAVLADDLAAAVREGAAITPSFADGLRAQRLLTAARRSAAG
jgi:predicted dehydrogenase